DGRSLRPSWPAGSAAHAAIRPCRPALAGLETRPGRHEGCRGAPAAAPEPPSTTGPTGTAARPPDPTRHRTTEPAAARRAPTAGVTDDPDATHTSIRNRRR